jgi:hypothetical protein
MSANNPEVTVLSDTGTTAVVSITGYYNAATTQNTKVLTANTLSFANTSQTCIVTLQKVQFSADVTGSLQLQWIGGSSNSTIMNFGTSQAGNFDAYVPNFASSPTGDINLNQIGLANNDVYNLILTLNKERGYANGYLQYDYNGQVTP